MVASVFIDGEAGTTGLQIRSRLAGRDDIRLLSLPEDRRKDVVARTEMLNSVDLAILCLPDDAAREAVGLIRNPDVRVIDASTAHRVSEGWVYGMPEYDAANSARIATASRVANTGCYAVASVAILHPLVGAGLLPANFPATINAVSGYSGGGRKLIESFEKPDAPDYTETPFRIYGLGLEHKHVEEIRVYSGLEHRPVFVPSVGRFRQGMIVQVPLQLWSLPGTPSPGDVHRILSEHYKGCAFVSVASLEAAAAMNRLEPEGLNGTNELHLFVFGNEARQQAVVMALLDNLGKGASGQVVQNMNLMFGLPETTGLEAVVGFS